MIYTGIGSRETPASTLVTMENIATGLGMMDFILRSGGANGADQAFENGAIMQGSEMEIILPWSGFNNKKTGNGYYTVPESIKQETERIAAHYHLAWDRLSQGARRLHSRNVCQILGLDLNTPTDLVICWTSDGLPSGGTGQALRIAIDYKIQIYNLFNEEDITCLQIAFR